MNKLLVLSVALFCFLDGTMATECRVCAFYHHNTCLHGKGTCTLKKNESCVRLEVAKEANHENEDIVILGCQKNCRSIGFHKKGIIAHTICCRNKDFCNEF